MHTLPESKFRGANVGPIWGRQDPGEHHVGTMNFAIWATMQTSIGRNVIAMLCRAECVGSVTIYWTPMTPF